MRLLFPSLLLLCAVSGTAQNASPTAAPEKPVVKHSEKKADGNVSQQGQKNNPPAAVAPSGPPSQPQPDPKKAESNAPPNDRIYKVDVVAQPRDWLYTLYVALTGAAVIIGVITAIAIWRQMKANEVSANAAKESADAVMRGERAWLLVQEGKTQDPYIVPPDAGADRFSQCICFLKNSGKTPAKIIGEVFEMQIGESWDTPPQPERVYGTETDRNSSMIPQDDTVARYIPFSGGFVSQSDFDSISKMRKVLWLCGFIRYRDVFERKGEEHETSFCYLWETRTTAPKFFWRAAGPREYNRAT